MRLRRQILASLWPRPGHGRPPWCGQPTTEERCACLRRPGHTGKHTPGFVNAWYADRYAATSGYRRQRRKRGYITPDSRFSDKESFRKLLGDVARALRRGERGDSNPRIPESQSGALTNLATPTESWERND